METWLLAGLLGLGLAAATGLKTFLPLLMLSAAARFELFGIELSGAFAWLKSDAALIALTVAAIAEFLADKIPVVDHALSAFGTVARPAAGALAAAAAFSGLDPAMAAVLGLIVGAPTALAFNTAQAGTRLTSTATTGGLANPAVSFAEDVLAFLTAALALAAPLLIPILLALMLFAAWSLFRRLVRRSRAA
ncbi:MAG: DUF4126 domain-containing protein [Phenylobacterium sp.]|jgi:hypothetical protein|uniref:DUF4126 domain-containing protein n=1 Tax=Phenylobacterium sp. TaxID=1871053 RepID=UPI002A372672|nr:DUF4126 domain-containing protein [Phenylobacterium sp.]MDX9998774.1 DUF4126 domain-containing protein [Phenylobacterium sp.]